MQYHLLKILASHNHITIVGDEDQSIFSFNGANAWGFDSFRRDFPTHKEIKLKKNYRSTRCIVEAASSLIHHNVKRCQLKEVETDNSTVWTFKSFRLLLKNVILKMHNVHLSSTKS